MDPRMPNPYSLAARDGSLKRRKSWGSRLGPALASIAAGAAASTVGAATVSVCGAEDDGLAAGVGQIAVAASAGEGGRAAGAGADAAVAGSAGHRAGAAAPA